MCEIKALSIQLHAVAVKSTFKRRVPKLKDRKRREYSAVAVVASFGVRQIAFVS